MIIKHTQWNIRDDVNLQMVVHLTAKDVAFSYNKAKELGEGADLSHHC